MLDICPILLKTENQHVSVQDWLFNLNGAYKKKNIKNLFYLIW